MDFKESTKSPHEQFYGKIPKFVDYLRTFGEVGIVSDEKSKKMRSKLQDRRKECLFVGYPEDHSGDVYRMLSLDTKKLILSRNVIWLNKNYAEYKNIPTYQRTKANSKDKSNDDDDTIVVSNGLNDDNNNINNDNNENDNTIVIDDLEPVGNDGNEDPNVFVETVDDESEDDSDNVSSDEAEDEEIPPPTTRRMGTRSQGISASHVTQVPTALSSKTERELKKLHTDYNPVIEGARIQEKQEHINMAMETLLQDRPSIDEDDIWLQRVQENLLAMLDDSGDDPKTYEEAMKQPDAK